jgi:hypothetical protein
MTINIYFFQVLVSHFFCYHIFYNHFYPLSTDVDIWAEMEIKKRRKNIYKHKLKIVENDQGV